MKIIGIIAEYNPLHNGHIYQIKQAKKIYNADYIIVVMSGPFTQNGNISLIDKYAKANIVIESGADLVIELPVIYATSSSEYFAKGAVKLLNDLQIVDNILFGTECEDILCLENIAKKLITNKEKILDDIQKENKNNTFATNRDKVLKNYLTIKEHIQISTPNNILGIEYIKNIIELNSSIKPICITRKGTVSSTIIRKNISNNDYNYLEENASLAVTNYIKNNKIMYENDNYLNKVYSLIRYKLLMLNTNQLKNIYEIAEGLENKLLNEIISSTNYEDFINNIKSKRYTRARIKRILINILLNISKDYYDINTLTTPVYAHILKANNNGKKLISKISKNSNINLLTSYKPNYLNKLNLEDNILNLINLDISANNIYLSIFNKSLNTDFINQI